MNIKKLAKNLEKTVKSIPFGDVAVQGNLTKEEVDLLKEDLSGYNVLHCFMKDSNSQYEIYVSRQRSLQNA